MASPPKVPIYPQPVPSNSALQSTRPHQFPNSTFQTLKILNFKSFSMPRQTPMKCNSSPSRRLLLISLRRIVKLDDDGRIVSLSTREMIPRRPGWRVLSRKWHYTFPDEKINPLKAHKSSSNQSIRYPQFLVQGDLRGRSTVHGNSQIYSNEIANDTPNRVNAPSASQTESANKQPT
jgi:hypothetical protein